MKKLLFMIMLLFSYNISFASSWLTIPQEEQSDIFYLFTFDVRDFLKLRQKMNLNARK